VIQLSKSKSERFMSIEFCFSKQKRKSVEEASRFMEKANRRVTTHLNRTDTLKEEAEADNDDTGSDDRSNVENKDQDLLPRRRFQRQSEYDTTNNQKSKSNHFLFLQFN